MMRPIKRLLENKNLLLTLAVLYSCGITVLFFISTSGLPRIKVSSIDKVIHGVVFFLLVCFWQLYAMQRRDGRLPWRISFQIVLWSLFYGIIIEVLQGLTTVTRSPDVLDVVANLVGAILGIVFFQKIKDFFTV